MICQAAGTEKLQLDGINGESTETFDVTVAGANAFKTTKFSVTLVIYCLPSSISVSSANNLVFTAIVGLEETQNVPIPT